MSQPMIARRYAQALYEQADATGVTERIDADMVLLRQTLSDSRELTQLFASPVVSRDRKKAVVRALFEARVESLTLQFVELMIDKRREGLFVEASAAYGALRDQQNGIVEVSVRSARVMSPDDQQAVTDGMEKLTGKTVRLVASTDPSLKGGLVVRIGDTVYDGSVAGRLANLRERLAHGTVSVN
jgi:F-type H+-transporting ATPase subunit delta